MADTLKIALAQINPHEGAILANADRIRRARAEAARLGADLVVTTEFSIAGYPPEDLVRKPAFVAACERAIDALAADTADGGPGLVVGAPWRDGAQLCNAARLLDGGRKKWELEARELTTETVTRPATEYKAGEPDLAIRAFRDEVVASIGTDGLVDVRSPDEYAGRLLAPAHLPQEQAQRGGHVPTAINVPWSKAANDDGTFKSDEELAKIYADAGLDGEKETIAYCRIGERSSHTWFVLQEILGHQNVKNYDGSWTEYGSLVGAPIELGS